MFEILVLVVVCSGIASLARGRGGNPVMFGVAAAVSYVIGVAISRRYFAGDVISFVLPWALVGLVALQVRFILGAGRAKPDSMWSCPDCNMVNESSYVVCQACSRPWTPV